MSFFDDLHKAAASRSPVEEKRRQIEVLRAKAQETFKAQFLLDASNKEKLALLKGRLEALNECLQLFMEAKEPPRIWEDDEV
ncbi:hypothetical protein GF339_14635 [candidate division KSB3 bacterium]|uniref:Uncharacterized protein n=1 Tax=candidate division KSB3 bacterium TaxID=2044937 RepID=A0A9D5JX89_9BACT|nr:hypothetical protein [candidate division KSB3 bacterium]MBD3325819.1 hypothetical protein [candidate division KSB3 bacterium]